MYKIGVIGDKDSILGFKALGLNVFPVSNAGEAETILNEIAKEKFAIIYIIEDIAVDMEETIDKYKDDKIPAIIPIPGKRGTLGIGMQSVKKSVERAVGADILFKD